MEYFVSKEVGDKPEIAQHEQKEHKKLEIFNKVSNKKKNQFLSIENLMIFVHCLIFGNFSYLRR